MATASLELELLPETQPLIAASCNIQILLGKRK
jgi:hypothetical protein